MAFFHSFGVALALAIVGGLGDKAFCLLLILGVWCPWQGVRPGKLAGRGRLLVFAGGVIGFLGRLIALAAYPDLKKVSIWLDIGAGTSLLLLGALAACERRRMTRASLKPASDSSEAEQAKRESSIPEDQQWNTSAFSWMPRLAANPFAGEEGPEDGEHEEGGGVEGTGWNKTAFPSLPAPLAKGEEYGTFGPPDKSASGILSEGLSDGLLSQITAVVLSLVLTFLLQADGKAETDILKFGPIDFGMAFGAWIGYTLVALMAACLARSRPSVMTKKQALSALTVLLFGLSLVSFCQAISSVPGLQPKVMR